MKYLVKFYKAGNPDGYPEGWPNSVAVVADSVVTTPVGWDALLTKEELEARRASAASAAELAGARLKVRSNIRAIVNTEFRRRIEAASGLTYDLFLIRCLSWVTEASRLIWKKASGTNLTAAETTRLALLAAKSAKLDELLAKADAIAARVEAGENLDPYSGALWA